MSHNTLSATISIGFDLDVSVISTDEQESLAQRIRSNAETLWDFVGGYRLTTLSNIDITKGTALCDYLCALVEEYCAADQKEKLGNHELFFARAVCAAWKDLKSLT